MATIGDIDPWHVEARMRWRNRVAEWRAEPAEPLWHAAVVLLLVALALPLGWNLLLAVAAPARDWLASGWPYALAGLLLIETAALRAVLAASELRRTRSWLAAQPVAGKIGRGHDRRHAFARMLLHSTGVLAIAIAWRQPLPVVAGFTAVPWLGGALALCLPQAAASSGAPPSRDVVLHSQAIGRLWRWQLIEIGSVLAPRRLSLLLIGWLLVPSGTGLAGALVFATGIVLVAGGIAAWLRSVAVLPAAQRMLAVQPVPPRRLLRAWIGVPLGLLTAVAMVSAALMPTLGAPALAVPVALGVSMIGLLQAAVAAAERQRPRNVAPRFAIHVVVLFALLQALPPLLLLAWPLQMSWLIRRSLRR